MRLHRLEFAGIGPFAGEHSISFTDLTASGLFLLEGPTGAGKSTLIDALVFALYGSLADNGGYDRLRSDHAGADQESFVDLVYEVGAGIYRIRRTPRYEKAKRRGEGTTTRQATAHLWQLATPEDKTGQLLATKVEESGAEVLRSIGLSREQFVQTVVLPQGQFASFLKAENEQRRVLLQRIFGTELYQRLAEELRNRRAAAGAVQQEIATDLRNAAVGLAKAAGVTAEQSDQLAQLAGIVAKEPEATELLESSESIWHAALSGAVDARHVAVDAVAASQRAQDLAAKSRTQAELAATRRDLLGRLAALEADSPRRQAAAEAVRAARRAGPAIPALDSARDAAAASAKARELADGLGLADGAAEESVLQEALQQALEHSRRLSEQLDAARELERAAAREQAAVAALEQATGDFQEAQTAADAAGRALARQAELGPSAKEAVERAAQQVAVVKEYGQAAAALAAAQTQLELAKRAYGEAQQTESRLRELRLAGLAGEMAAALEPGQPCPVCGAVEHPAPAALAQDHASRDQVAQAETSREAAESAYEDAARAANQAKDLVSRLEGGGGQADPAQAKHALGAARKVRDQLGDPHKLKAALEQAQANLERTREAAETAQAAAKAAHDQVVATKSRADGATIDAAAAALAAAQTEADLARQRLQAAQRLASATELAELTAQGAQRALVEAGFASAEEARAAALPPAEIEHMQASLEKLAGEETSLRQRLAEPSLAQVSGDPDALAEAAAQAAAAATTAEAAAREAAEAAALAEGKAQSTGQAVAEIRAAQERLACAQAESAALARVADLANSGQANLRDVDLPTYVLIRRFEEVIDAANARLGPMSDGQYLLERSDTKEATRKRRTGLALRVMDNSTGQARDPRTLSGGETFYVSLALALGLADVVTAEAGGISLETLFVDEGFGSLSDEALESVLTQLNRIRAGGRVVGLVSHVEALKQAIPDRIEVRPSRQGGSTLRVRSAVP
ncbi:MAG: SMC family ATPase [Bifidobacteriaceae bacterium]|jgi:exonuclease SbcC|nr:SMC family ATPase [Bifidobacteriaceae bacterium]